MTTDFVEIANTVERVLEREEEACQLRQHELDAARQNLRRRRATIKRRRHGLERFVAEWQQAGMQGEDDGKAEGPDPDGKAPADEFETVSSG